MSSKGASARQRKNANSSSQQNTSSNEQNAQDQPANPQQQNAGQQQEQSGFSSLVQVIARIIVIYYIVTWLFKGKQPTQVPPTDPSSAPNTNSASAGLNLPTQIVQLWPVDSSMDLRVYISEQEQFTNFDDPSALVWYSRNIKFGNWDDAREKQVVIKTTANVQRNGTLYAHIYLTLERAPHNEEDPGFQQNMRVYRRKLLTRYLPKRREVKTKKLIGGAEKEEEDQKLSDSDLKINATEKAPIISYWYQNLTLNIISDNALVPYTQLPSVVTSEIPFETTGMRDPTGKYGYYLPIVYVNDFWMLNDHMTEINETVTTLPLNIIYYPVSFMKFQMYAQFEESFRSQAEFMGGSAHSEFDELKRMLLETNPILLGVTITVSILHSVFEFLAFKNDISDWKDKKEMTGISIRTIAMNIFFQLVIFFYLFDNNEETSWMILIGQGIGLLIEIWKIKKAVSIEIKPRAGSAIPYSIRFVDKHTLSETEKKTKEYDQLAFRYLSWVAFPLLFGYSIYSLLYNTHKSWYSFILTTLVGFVYTFGFIMMTPQLFINYKLKSVAHMPWKTLMYKTLGTFVDDLFAFCIKMPTLHRLACLRDDVVFFVYIYQRYIYPVDKKRANEYGQVGERSDQTEKSSDDQQPVESKKEK